MLKCHSEDSSKYLCTSGWMIISRISLAAALNILALSKMITCGLPHLAQNLETPEEGLGRHVWNDIDVNGLSNTTCVEADLHLVTSSDLNGLDIYILVQQNQLPYVRMACFPVHRTS